MSHKEAVVPPHFKPGAKWLGSLLLIQVRSPASSAAVGLQISVALGAQAFAHASVQFLLDAAEVVFWKLLNSL